MGGKIQINVTGDTVKFNESQLLKADIACSNGTIDVIDAVILPAVLALPTDDPPRSMASAKTAGIAEASMLYQIGSPVLALIFTCSPESDFHFGDQYFNGNWGGRGFSANKSTGGRSPHSRNRNLTTPSSHRPSSFSSTYAQYRPFLSTRTELT